MTSREEVLAETFVQLADTLVDDFDVVEFMQTLAEQSVRVMNLDAAGLLLVDHHGQLQLMVACSSQPERVEFVQDQYQDGPGLEAFRSARPVSCPDLRFDADRWPGLVAAATAVGLVSAYAVPMRLRDQVLGALVLFSRRRDAVGADQMRVAQALADIASVGILHERAAREKHLLVEQLQTALNTRVVLEQAKGILAARRRCGLEDAFVAMRRFARDHNWHLTAVAKAVIADTPAVAVLTSPESS